MNASTRELDLCAHPLSLTLHLQVFETFIRTWVVVFID